MMKKKVKTIFAAVLVSFCLIFISNFIGNALIPSFTINDVAKSINHDWIKWPEPINKLTKNPNSVKEELETTKTTSTLIQGNKSDVAVIKLEKAPTTLEKSLAALLLTTDAVKGGKIARKCVACHSFKKGGKNKIGPNLYGILGQDRATVAGFRYSDAIKKKVGKWGFADMDKFLLKPKNFIPKTKMSFKGIKNASERAAVIMYLRSFSEAPLALPK
jgi:cytochrome c